MGAFVAGVVLANNEYRHELESDVEPFKGLLLGVFFIAVGASIDFALVTSSPGKVLMLLAILVVTKAVVLFVIGRIFRMSLDQNFLFTFSLAQGSEFAYVLFSFATQNGVLSQEQVGPLVAAVALSMALTPVLMMINERLIQPNFGTREKPDREADDVDEKNPVLIAGFGDFGSVVGRLMFANGVGTTVLEHDADHVEMLRKLGYRVYYGDASRTDLLEAAGAAAAKLIVLATGDHAESLAMVETIKKHFPNLTIFARALGRYEAYELTDAGADYVYRESLDTSLRTGVDVLRELGFRAFQARRAAQTMFRHDESAMRELGEMRHDRKRYISTARERIRDLENTLLAELETRDETRDMGWDTETLRADAEGVGGHTPD